MITTGTTMVQIVVIAAFMNGDFGPEFLIHSGILGSLIISLISAAYVATKTIDATVSFTNTFYAVYSGSSTFGDLLGLWELLFILLWLSWSLVVTILAFITASTLYDELEARSVAAATEGLYGQAVNIIDGIKGFTLLAILAMGVWISAYIIGDTADELLDWFNEYDANTRREAIAKTTGIYDADGAAFLFDFVYHAITALYSFFVMSAIMIGGYVFAFGFYSFKPVANCNLATADANAYTGISTGILALNDGTYE